ncbi:hypothetical protein AYI70_g1976, partial [Smittium culicis]
MDAYLARLKDIASSATRSASAVAIATTTKVVDSIQGKLARDYSLSPTPYTTVGCWSLHLATSLKSGKDATAWVLTKKTLKQSSPYGQYGDGSFSDKLDYQNSLDFFKKEVSELTKLRHPSMYPSTLSNH